MVETFAYLLYGVPTLEQEMRIGVPEGVWVKLRPLQSTPLAQPLEAGSHGVGRDAAPCLGAREEVRASVGWPLLRKPAAQ